VYTINITILVFFIVALLLSPSLSLFSTLFFVGNSIQFLLSLVLSFFFFTLLFFAFTLFSSHYPLYDSKGLGNINNPFTIINITVFVFITIITISSSFFIIVTKHRTTNTKERSTYFCVLTTPPIFLLYISFLMPRGRTCIWNVVTKTYLDSSLSSFFNLLLIFYYFFCVV